MTVIAGLAGVLGLWSAGLHGQTPVAGQGGGRGAGPAGTGVGGSGLPQIAGGRGGPPAAPKKRVLLFGQTTSFHHGSISTAIGPMYQVLNDSGVFDVEIRTDAKWISKQPDAFSGEGHNLDGFDVLFAISPVGSWDLSDQQKKDLLAFVRDDGKGFVGAHGALDANHDWPEYLDLIGGEAAGHPWNTFAAPLVIEDPTFPAMRPFSSPRLTLYDEIYMARGPWAREKVDVLMRLDDARLPAPARVTGPVPPPANALREDRDFAVAWAKTYGRGRVFYSSLGHVTEAWLNPEIQKMYLEATKWAAGLIDGSTASHPRVK
jgi:type 1 glutamine amidotransferase